MTNNTLSKRVLSAVLCLVLIAAMALTFTACKNEENPASAPTSSTATVEPTELGEGATVFDLQVVDKGGNTTNFVIRTDEKTVGAALQKVELLKGEEGPYGLYVKTVNGITADYDVDKTYWAFYIDGVYAMTGVDKTGITAGAVYMLKIES